MIDDHDLPVGAERAGEDDVAGRDRADGGPGGRGEDDALPYGPGAELLVALATERTQNLPRDRPGQGIVGNSEAGRIPELAIFARLAKPVDQGGHGLRRFLKLLGAPRRGGDLRLRLPERGLLLLIFTQAALALALNTKATPVEIVRTAAGLLRVRLGLPAEAVQAAQMPRLFYDRATSQYLGPQLTGAVCLAARGRGDDVSRGL